MTRDFRELQVWEKAHQLALGVYEATALFPKEEKYGITAQMRRAASSVPMNIAEGCGRLGDAELNRFLHIAAGSARELDYQLLLARDLGMLNGHAYEARWQTYRRSSGCWLHSRASCVAPSPAARSS
jgi:four helix bundle protein